MVSEHYDDLEPVQACLDGWDAELILLGRSRSAAWTSMAILPSTRVVQVHAGRSILIRGTPSAIGCLMLSSSHEAPVRWLGQPIDAGRFAVAGRGARIDVFLPGDATLCIIAAESLADVLPKRMQLRTATSECVSKLMRCAEFAADNDASPGSNRLPHAIDEVLDRQIGGALEASTVLAPGAGTRSLRAIAVARACRFIDLRLGKPISLADLCRHCGVGVRTLEYGFRQLYETTPISFIKSQRLSRTHSALLQISGQPVSIRQIATRLGFTHMGQFAQDYRMLFGESPSATLQRARQRRDADRSGCGRDDVPAELTPGFRSDPASQQLLRKARGSGSRGPG